jgi:hypothetical protein
MATGSQEDLPVPQVLRHFPKSLNVHSYNGDFGKENNKQMHEAKQYSKRRQPNIQNHL